MCINALLGIGSALIGTSSASKAAKAQTTAAGQQLDLQREMYEADEQRFEPFLGAGQQALGAYQYEMGMGDRPEGYGGMQASPAFNFMLGQGLEDVQSSAAMRGKMGSGSTLQAMEDYRMGLAQQESTNWLNRLQGMTNMGQASAGMQSAAGQNYATGAGTAMANAGNAQAAGAIGVGNAIAGGINTGLNAYGYFNNLNQQPQQPQPMQTPMMRA